MKKIFATRENKGLLFNSALNTRSYSNYPDNKSHSGIDHNWVTGLVDQEGSFIIFIKSI